MYNVGGKKRKRKGENENGKRTKNDSKDNEESVSQSCTNKTCKKSLEENKIPLSMATNFAI